MLNPVKQPETNQNEQILFLREQIKSLNDELKSEREHSRKQTDELSELAQKLAEITRNQQLLLGAEQSRSNPALLVGDKDTEQPPQEEKRGFWSLFKRKYVTGQQKKE